MCDATTQFQMQGYLHVPNLLNKVDCAELTVQLKKIVSSGKTIKDEQCPLSEAIRDVPVFDSLLEGLIPNLESISGRKLLPTYAYARLYAPGEELQIHTDRPSCEISATITLGFEGDVWPIYMADHDETKTSEKKIGEHGREFWLKNISRIDMSVGDAVLYYGQNKVHWRDKFEGKWQAQVFLHYVDANGSNTAWKYDGRSKLAHHDPSIFYWNFPNAFPQEAAKRVIENAEQRDKEEATIGVGTTGVLNKEVRDVKKILLPPWGGLGAQMAGMALEANRQAWKFNLSHANQCEYLIYDIAGHYHPHIDTAMDPKQEECRKLTVLAFLNDDFEGGRLFLQVGHEKMYPIQKAGTVLVFPSFILHGVEPVVKGIRRSIVTWMVGPWFK